MRVRTLSAIATAAVLATTALTAATAAPAGAAPPDERAPAGSTSAVGLRVLHWNIAGALWHPFDWEKPDNRGGLNVVKRLVREAQERQPMVISMNEVCRNQADYVVQQLWAAGRPVFMQYADSAGGNFYCEDSGNAVITVGAFSTYDPATYYFDGDVLTSTKTERSATCMTASFLLALDNFVRVCSLHLATDDATAQKQARLFADFVTEDGLQYPTVLIGDFNAPPNWLEQDLYAPEAGGHGLFYESDMASPNKGRPTFGTPSPREKLDYIFADRLHFAPEMTTDVEDGGQCRSGTGNHPCSDHQMLASTLTLLPDPDPAPAPGDPEPTPPEPVDAPPFVNAGLGASGDEGAAIRLDGSADDDHGEPAVSWSYRAESGVDAGAACTFLSPGAADTTFTCTDDGTYRVTLTARHGVNAPVSASATVSVKNVAPSISLATPAAWQVVRADTAVTLTAPISDPGSNDTHTCTVAWDDRHTDSFAAGSGACRRSHTFADAGMYTIRTTVVDDDGGTASATRLVVVYDPEAGGTNANGWIDAPGRAGFTFSGSYQSPTATLPQGAVTFALQQAGINLRAHHQLEWVVITPDGKLAIKGTGENVPGQSVRFVLYGYDGCTTAGQTGCVPGDDRLRAVIWDAAAGAIPEGVTPRYDNRPGASFDLDDADPQPISAGIIQIQRR